MEDRQTIMPRCLASLLVTVFKHTIVLMRSIYSVEPSQRLMEEFLRVAGRSQTIQPVSEQTVPTARGVEMVDDGRHIATIWIIVKSGVRIASHFVAFSLSHDMLAQLECLPPAPAVCRSGHD